MTVEAQETRWRSGRNRRLLTAVLAVAMLVPLGVMVFDQHRYQSEHRSMATQERHAIEYLLALSPLTIALTEAQSAAVSGEPARREALDQAMAGVTDVDERFAEQLRLGERWPQLRNVIERVAGTDHADGRAAYTAYTETTGLLLALHDRLRDTTGLVRDPDQDAYHLQNAAGGALPETIVAIGRLVDLITIATSDPASEEIANAADIRAANAAATRPADALVVSVQEALDTTDSRSLSSTVLAKYDRFLRGKDILLGAVPADGSLQDGDPALIGGMRGEVQAAAEELSTGLLTELDALVENRGDGLATGQRVTTALAIGAVLLVLALVALSLFWEPRVPAHHRGELPSGSGGDGRNGGPGRGTPELPSLRTSISDGAVGYRARADLPAPGDRLAGDVLGAGRADVR